MENSRIEIEEVADIYGHKISITTTSVWKAVPRRWSSNNFNNGDANLEIAPGIFATHSAYWFLRELGCVGPLD